MKKYISILLAAVMAVCCLSACGQNNSNTNTQAKDNNDKQVKVVTTIFPEYDWVKEIAGDEVSNMDLTMLLDNGVDLHSYQPTADDIMKISDCIFLFCSCFLCCCLTYSSCFFCCLFHCCCFFFQFFNIF